jgi:hypothetical protein
MEMQTPNIDETNDRTIGFGPMDVMKEVPPCFKILTNFIKGNYLKNSDGNYFFHISKVGVLGESCEVNSKEEK